MARDAIDGKGLSLESNRQRRADMDAGLSSLGVDTNSLAFQGSKLAGEIAGTAGTGNILGLGARAAGAAPRMINALQSGGMTVGPGGSFGTNVLARTAGGAANGAVSAGLVNPSDAGWGAGIGGSVHHVAAISGGVSQVAGNALRNFLDKPVERTAKRISNYLGMGAEELSAALRQEGPQMVPGYRPTVPQILQTPEASQLQRTLKTAGGNALGNAERLQQPARAALRARQGSRATPTPAATVRRCISSARR